MLYGAWIYTWHSTCCQFRLLSHFMTVISILYRTLQGHKVDSNNDGGPQFAEVFVVVWVGSFVVTLNSKLLGGTM